MLHRDGAERGKRGGLLQHAFGDVRLQPNAFPLSAAERAGLVENRVGDAEATEAVHQAGTTKRREIVTRYAKRAARFVREVGDGLAVAEEVRRLQVDEVRDRPQRGLELRVGEAHSEGGLRGDDRLPCLGRIEAREDVVWRVAKRGGNGRIELLARALARELDRRRRAADPVRTSANSASPAMRAPTGTASPRSFPSRKPLCGGAVASFGSTAGSVE